METEKQNCEAYNIELINKVKPNMPEMRVLYELSDFLR